MLFVLSTVVHNVLHGARHGCNALCMTTALPVPEEDLNWDLCDRLGKSLRVSRLSVQEMADYLGVHRNTVGAYLNGRVEPLKCALHCAMLCNMSSDTELIGSTEASRVLKRHPATLSRWVADGKLTPVGRLSDAGAFVFRRADVETFAAELHNEAASA